MNTPVLPPPPNVPHDVVATLRAPRAPKPTVQPWHVVILVVALGFTLLAAAQLFVLMRLAEAVEDAASSARDASGSVEGLRLEHRTVVCETM